MINVGLCLQITNKISVKSFQYVIIGFNGAYYKKKKS